MESVHTEEAARVSDSVQAAARGSAREAGNWDAGEHSGSR